MLKKIKSTKYVLIVLITCFQDHTKEFRFNSFYSGMTEGHFKVFYVNKFHLKNSV